VDLHDSHRAVSLGDLKDLPVGAGVNQNDGQYFPVYGWLEVGFQPLIKHVRPPDGHHGDDEPTVLSRTAETWFFGLSAFSSSLCRLDVVCREPEPGGAHRLRDPVP
jgi:hypothetical protein